MGRILYATRVHGHRNHSDACGVPYRAYTHVTVIAIHMHARNGHRNSHPLGGCAVVVSIDAHSARYRLKTRVCENALQRGRSCVTVCMCVLYSLSTMWLFVAQVAMRDFSFLVADGFDYMTAFDGPECDGSDIDVSIPVVYPRVLRCYCMACTLDVHGVLAFIEDDMDEWVKRHAGLHGFLWRPSMRNMRALRWVASRRARSPRTRLAMLCLHASHLQMRSIWRAKRALDQWFRFVARRRRAWLRASFGHRVPLVVCRATIESMVFAPPRRLIFRH